MTIGTSYVNTPIIFFSAAFGTSKYESGANNFLPYIINSSFFCSATIGTKSRSIIAINIIKRYVESVSSSTYNRHWKFATHPLNSLWTYLTLRSYNLSESYQILVFTRHFVYYNQWN